MLYDICLLLCGILIGVYIGKKLFGRAPVGKPQSPRGSSKALLPLSPTSTNNKNNNDNEKKEPLSKGSVSDDKTNIKAVPAHILALNLPHYEGYLYKKATNFALTSFQMRYFVLKNTNLFYYKNEDKQQALAVIDVGSLHDFQLFPKKLELHFELKSVHKYVLKSDDLEKLKQWHDKLTVSAVKLRSLGSNTSEDDEFRKYCKPFTEEIPKVYELVKKVPNASHFTALRFLRARKLNIELATKFLESYMSWREATFPLELDNDIREELMKGKYYLRGRDRDNHLCVCVPVAKLIRGDYKSIDVAIKTMIFGFEWICNSDLLTNPMDTWTLLVDTRNMGFENCDNAFVAGFADVVQNRYPERLHKLILYPANSFVRGFWHAIKHFFDPNTAAKVILLENMEDIKIHVDPSQLNIANGGTDSFIFDPKTYISYIERNDSSIAVVGKKLKAEDSEITPFAVIMSTPPSTPKRRTSMMDVFKRIKSEKMESKIANKDSTDARKSVIISSASSISHGENGKSTTLQRSKSLNVKRRVSMV